jgi:hypothetical protein
MEVENFYVKNLKLCFLYKNHSIQLLSSLSLIFSQDNEKRIYEKNELKIFGQLNDGKLEIKIEKQLLNHRIFIIYSHLEIFSYQKCPKNKIDSYRFEKNLKRENYFLSYLDPIILEKILHLAFVCECVFSLNKKKIEIIELLCEIKKGFLIADLVGVLESDECFEKYICDGNQYEMQIKEISFHIFRKLTAFNNIKIIENNFFKKAKINLIFRDKLITKNKLSEFISYFLEGYYYLLNFWMNTVKINLKYFFKWVTNVFNYKLHIDKLFCNFSFLKIDRREYLNQEDAFSSFNTQIVSKLSQKKYGKLLTYSVEDLKLISFIRYGEIISIFFENSNNKSQGFGLEIVKLIELGKSSGFEENIFDIFGFVYFQEMFSGIMELKNTILKIKEKKIKYGFEEKIIFSIGLIVFKNYSDRILNFLFSKIHKQDFIVFLKTGNHMIYKNFVSLCLMISINSPMIIKKFLNFRWRKIIVSFLKNFGRFILKKYDKKFIFENNLKKKKFLNFRNKILITFLISFSLIHTHNLNDSFKNFYTEITHLIKNINYNSVLNREQDSLIKFIPLIFGVYVLGKNCDLNQFNFRIQFFSNRFFQKICIKMVQYCSFLGTLKKNLIKVALKEIKLFDSIKTKKSEKIFIIQEKFKKIKNSPIFLAIYDSNVDYETDRSFIYLKTSVEISMLGLCLLSFGDKFKSKLTFRIQSFLLSSDSVEYSSFAILSTALLFVSNTECPAIDFIIKLSGNDDINTIKNSIFSLGLIGAGTNNTRIKNALKCLANYYKLKLEDNYCNKKIIAQEDNFQFFRKVKSIIFLIRISQGMVNSFYCTLSQLNHITKEINTLTLKALLFGIIGFMISSFIGQESIFPSFFLFGVSLKSKLVYTFNDNFKVSSSRLKNSFCINLNKKYILTPCFLTF